MRSREEAECERAINSWTKLKHKSHILIPKWQLRSNKKPDLRWMPKLF